MDVRTTAVCHDTKVRDTRPPRVWLIPEPTPSCRHHSANPGAPTACSTMAMLQRPVESGLYADAGSPKPMDVVGADQGAAPTLASNPRTLEPSTPQGRRREPPTFEGAVNEPGRRCSHCAAAPFTPPGSLATQPAHPRCPGMLVCSVPVNPGASERLILWRGAPLVGTCLARGFGGCMGRTRTTGPTVLTLSHQSITLCL